MTEKEVRNLKLGSFFKLNDTPVVKRVHGILLRMDVPPVLLNEEGFYFAASDVHQASEYDIIYWYLRQKDYPVVISRRDDPDGTFFDVITDDDDRFRLNFFDEKAKAEAYIKANDLKLTGVVKGEKPKGLPQVSDEESPQGIRSYETDTLMLFKRGEF